MAGAEELTHLEDHRVFPSGGIPPASPRDALFRNDLTAVHPIGFSRSQTTEDHHVVEPKGRLLGCFFGVGGLGC